MRQIKKHSFEPVSLLTVDNGVLELAIIPAKNQPSWLVPKSLILSIDAYNERIWTYLWNEQEVSVYHLTPKGDEVSTLVVLEGNTDVHRMALQIMGDIQYISVRISDVKDAQLPEEMKTQMAENIPSLLDGDDDFDYVYQAVNVQGELYIVPELDLIAHRLVDLDS
ncbi:MAG: hypothetical protein Q4B88_00415 [Moraxella sp.]|nr:hypothetical protein [Moraxella sp.]